MFYCRFPKKYVFIVCYFSLCVLIPFLDQLFLRGEIHFYVSQSDERQQEIEKNVTDQEQRYLKYMCKQN